MLRLYRPLKCKGRNRIFAAGEMVRTGELQKGRSYARTNSNGFAEENAIVQK